MHELVKEWSARGGPELRLARLPLDEGALLAAFGPGGRGRRLQWLAKTAYGTAACRRLRAEREALEKLAPLTEHLHIPRLLDWSESGAGSTAEACLLQSALSGQPMHCRWPGKGSVLPQGLETAGAWLRQFQTLCRQQAALDPCLDLQDWARHAQVRLAAVPSPAEELLHPLLPLLLHAGQPYRSVLAHGDFWAGNMIWTEPDRGRDRRSVTRAGVVDWSGLGPGSALDDLLNWTASLPCGQRSHPGSRLKVWQLLWFTAGPVRQYLRAWAVEAGYTAEAARAAFYLFLARRLAWELGMDLQARNQAERARAQAEWSEALAWLQRHEFPDPFTGPPACTP